MIVKIELDDDNRVCLVVETIDLVIRLNTTASELRMLADDIDHLESPVTQTDSEIPF